MKNGLIREQYALTPGDEVLLAAAYASRGDERMVLALRVYRAVSGTASHSTVRDVAREAGHYLRAQLARKDRGYPPRSPAKTFARIELQDTALRVLCWMAEPACPHCKGRGHMLIPSTPVLDVRRRCNRCKGTGLEPLERAVRSEHTQIAHELHDSLQELVNRVFADMTNMVNGRMSLFGAAV